MSGVRPDVRKRIEQYRQECAAADADVLATATRKALGDGHYLLVARAAEICAERLLYDLEPDLMRAYDRLLKSPAKKDPSCTAKGAIARALVALDCQDSSIFVAGTRYRQLEPVWGGTADTAVDLRCSCAMGLVGTPYPRALIELVVLLNDPEPHARSGAVRAIACTEPLAAEAVLRSKALSGDSEAEVIGDCLAGLLRVEPDEAPAFVAEFLHDPDPAKRELAALALGESRTDATLGLLREQWELQPLKREEDRALLRAAVLHRSESAFEWLLSVVESGDVTSAELVIVELAAYRANHKLRRRLGAALDRRGEERLLSRFEAHWAPEQD